MEWHHPQAPQRTNSKSLHQGPRLWVIPVDTMPRGGDKPILHQCADRTNEAFQKNSASYESNKNLASAWQCKASHKSEDFRSHHKMWLDVVTPPTLQPRSGTLAFPPIWSPEACN
jgi:hypothetical protein